MQLTIARRKAKFGNARTGSGSGGAHRHHPDHGAIRAQRVVNEYGAVHDQVESEEQAEGTWNTEQTYQAIGQQAWTKAGHSRSVARTMRS
jgi:hypothetical protein